VTGWAAQGARFLAFGVVNTAVTYAIYCLLVFWLHPQLAYALVFALGIAIAYAGNALWVFRSGMRWSTALPYVALYLGQYVANALAVYLFMEHLGLGPRVALAAALVLVTPVSFLLNKALLGRAGRRDA
jgi:putative flippase GtrA